MWTFGSNSVMNAVVCQSNPLTMAVSRTSAFSSITLTTNGGATTVVSANNGDGSCFACATSPPSVSAAGFQSSTGDLMRWQVSFPTRSTVQMCVSRPGGDSGRWGDSNLRISYSIVTTPCVAGEYIDANYICRKCPAGTFGATTPLVGPQCSGACAAGTYSALGATACSATAACPIGQYRNQTSGECATCSGATPVVEMAGAACVASCPAGTLNVNGLCTPAAADATYADIFAVGVNAVGIVNCCPVTMAALSPTAAFKSVSFEVHNGVNAYSASAGQCFGCASQIVPPVQSSA